LLIKPRDDLKDLKVDGKIVLKYNYENLFLKCEQCHGDSGKATVTTTKIS